MLGPLEVPAPGLQGLAVGGLLWAHGTPLALALGVTVMAGSPPFSVPAFWKVGARPRVVQASFGPAAASGRSVLRKAWCRSPRAAVTLVTSPWRLVGPGGRELSAQLALGAGAWAGMPPPTPSGDFQGRRMDCSWKSNSVPLGAAPEEAAAPCPQRVPGAFQSRGRGGLPRQSNGSDATLPVRDSQVELVVKNPLAKARDARDTGSIPGSGRSPWRRKWQEFQEILT